MEDEMILNRPSGRRLVEDDNELPPGPPGTESDTFEIGRKKRKSSPQSKENERNNKSSPSPRRRRSPSPRQSRNRESASYGHDYGSPRRYGNNSRRRSRDRIRSPNHSNDRSRGRNERRRERRSRSRERYRSRRSKSLSNSPRGRRWSPMRKKPTSPPPMPPAPYVIPPNVYSDGYANYPPQYAAQQYTSGEYAATPAAPPFTAPYPPPPAWSMQVPPDDFSTHPAAWNTVPPVHPPAESEEEQLKRDAAVAQEVQNQRDQLKKQRSDYLKRAAALKRELKILKEQRNDLVSGNNPPSPTTKGFVDENDRLQNQIQKKLTTIENVVDMLSGIIGEDKPPTPQSPSKVGKKKKRNNSDDDDSSPERLKTKVIESMKTKREVSKKDIETSHSKNKSETSKKSEDVTMGKKINYVFYDPEMHWCQLCDVFPKTAKDFLNHLQSKEHSEMIKTPQTPWHDAAVSDEFPTNENAQTKRTPIRGLQFFIPSSCWYCKLCNIWMGDLHCASTHLKSQTHSEKYNAFIEQNPHFEVDWMAERQKSYDLQRAPPPPQITSVSTTGMDLLESIPLQINNQKGAEVDKSSKKRKKKSEEKKDKKKKKRSKKRKKSSSSSSSSSDTSSESDSDKNKEDCQTSSIRVVMRNLFKTQGDPGDMEIVKGKWTTVQEGVPPPEPIPPPPPTINPPDPEAKKRDDLMISQWSTPQPIISESEKKLLEELKGKLKAKPEDDRKKNAADNVKNDIGKNIKKSESHVSDKGRRSRSKNRKSPSPSNQNSAGVSRDKRSRSRAKRSRSRDRRSKSRARRSRSRNRNKRSRSRGVARRSRSRDRRSRSRNRRSNSRNRTGRRRRSRDARRSRSPVGRHARRRSYSRSRSRSRSRSSTHRIEKPIVRYPEFRPRVPENKKVVKVKTDEESERKKSPVVKKSAQSISGKKLPFIGRMPVFKKQIPGNEEKKEGENIDYLQMDPTAMGYDNFENLVMMDYDDLMPDPMQYVTLMGAPPPPPGPPPDDDKDILPPGIDETETDSIPKPISDAPIPRKGPLPRDFEEALNIIFPGDNQPSVGSDGKEIKRTKGTDVTNTLEHSTDNGPKELPIEDRPLNFGAVYSDHSQDISDISLVPAIPPPPPPPPPEVDNKEKEAKSIEKEDIVKESEKKKELSPTDSEKLRRQAELADLAMLGIDADDLAAQCM